MEGTAADNWSSGDVTAEGFTERDLTTWNGSLEANLREGIGPAKLSEPFYCTWYNTLMFSINVTLQLTGIVGNTLTVIISWRHVKKSATMLLVIGLAFADMFFLVLNGLMVLSTRAGMISGNQKFLSYALTISYVFIGNISVVLLLIIVWLTVLIIWHRYRAIITNHAIIQGHLPKMRIQMAIGVTLSILYNLPRFFERKIIYNSYTELISFENTYLRNSTAYMQFYSTILYYIVYYIVPIIIIIILTWKSLRALSVKFSEKLTKQTLSQINQYEITKSLISIVVIFLICHTVRPIRRVLLLHYKDQSHSDCGGIMFFVNSIMMLISSLNSSVNFFVYVFCIRRFRKQVFHLFKSHRSVAPSDLVKSDAAAVTEH